jgi:virulence-associated protein VagC
MGRSQAVRLPRTTALLPNRCKEQAVKVRLLMHAVVTTVVVAPAPASVSLI